MSARKSPSGPASSLTGFVALAQTVLPPGSAAAVAVTATGFAQIFVGPAGTAIGLMNAKVMSTNDVVTGSPRGTVPLATTQVGLSYARIVSVGTSSAIVEMAFTNMSTASATVVANTWNIDVALFGADV